jgi:hypothetical protein
MMAERQRAAAHGKLTVKRIARSAAKAIPERMNTVF